MISANGHEYITLDDNFYVNGNKVYEATVNGRLVYPRHVGSEYVKIWGKINARCKFIYSSNNRWEIGWAYYGMHDDGEVNYSYSAGFVWILKAAREYLQEPYDIYVDDYLKPNGQMIGLAEIGDDNNIISGYPYDDSKRRYYSREPSIISYRVLCGQEPVDTKSMYTFFYAPDGIRYPSQQDGIFVYKNTSGFPLATDYTEINLTSRTTARCTPKNRSNLSLPIVSGRMYRYGDLSGEGFYVDPYMSQSRTKKNILPSDKKNFHHFSTGFGIYARELSCVVNVDERRTISGEERSYEKTDTNSQVLIARVPITGASFHNTLPQIDENDIAFIQSV